jgi:hypothetical protein
MSWKRIAIDCAVIIAAGIVIAVASPYLAVLAFGCR